MLPKNYNEIINDISLLENYIKDQADKYYTDGSNELEDAEFDALVDKLRQLNPMSPVLGTGWGFKVKGKKFKHKYCHIGSLDKTKCYKDINEIFKNKVTYISPKLDGLSAVCYYVHGKLIKALTRGDGEYGKDITDKLKLIEGDSIKDSSFTGSVRGELILDKIGWKSIQQTSSSELIAPRNYVAGIINRDDITDDIKYVNFVTYKILGNENTELDYERRDDILRWLSSNFKHSVPIYYFESLTEEFWNKWHVEIFNKFKELGYELDGLVLTPEIIPYDKKNMCFIYSEQAFKFESETTSTEIQSIEWNLSKNQRLIPVAVIKPVQLAGAVIQRVTCNNAKQVKDWGLGKGCQVVVTRSNEVIPQILSVVECSNDSLPEVCPVCHQPLEWNGVDLVCCNRYCPNIDRSDLEQWCTIIGQTDGLQWTTIQSYLELYNIHTIRDLYDSKDKVFNDFNSKKLSITDTKMLQFFNKIYNDPVSLYNVLLALNIPRLGSVTCKLLSKYPDLIFTIYRYAIGEVVRNYTLDNLKQDLINIVKTATTDEIIKNIDKFERLNYFYTGDNFRIICNYDAQKEVIYVAVTGSLNSMKRKDFEKYIARYGYELTSNISKCKYLITNNLQAMSSKSKEAEKYGIPKITEQQFLDILQ